MNQYQKGKAEEVLIKHQFEKDQRGLVLLISPKIENYIRQFIAAAYIEQNNEQLKSDKVGRDELKLTKYHLAQYIESMVRNHSIINVNMYKVEPFSLEKTSYKFLSTDYINDWMNYSL